MVPKTWRAQCTATSAVKSFNLLIEHQCPQCGAPAVLQETDRLFRCAFCRVTSFLTVSDRFRYLLPDTAPQDKELFYFPYWRFKGMLFSCLAGGVQQKFIDTSYQAFASPHFPVSLGFRSQALKLRFVTPECRGRFLPNRFSMHQVMEVFKGRFRPRIPQPVYHQAQVGDHLGLIFAPYYAENGLIDAVLNEPIGKKPEDLDRLLTSAEGPGNHLKFIPSICPACGWDLEGSRQTLVLLCRNCDSAWHAPKNRLERLKYGHLPAPADDGHAPVLFLPFWRIRARIDGLGLDSYADLVKLANIPKVSRPGWQDIPFFFWCPAFKIRPQTFLPLATKLTLSQPQERPFEALPDREIHAVTLPVGEAAECLKVILANFAKPRKTMVPRLGDVTITPQSYLLVYIPFHQHHHDLIQPRYRISILKNQLALAKSL